MMPLVPDAPFRADTLDAAIDRIETKLDGLAGVVGFAARDEHGQLVGTGVAGDLARLSARVDTRFSRDDGRTRYVAGATAAAALFMAAIWWLIRGRLEALFH